MQTIVITGGAGFIGSCLVRRVVGQGRFRVVNLDKLTYAGNLDSLLAIADSPLYRFEQADICDLPRVAQILAAYQPVAILHLAAESHVD